MVNFVFKVYSRLVITAPPAVQIKVPDALENNALAALVFGSIKRCEYIARTALVFSPCSARNGR